MPQVIRVLKCFECEMFQVDIVKKTNKWQCKSCGVKQSLRREFFRGSGAECRAKAQELNMLKGQQQEAQAIAMLDHIESDNLNFAVPAVRLKQNNPTEIIKQPTKIESKWCKYTEENSDYQKERVSNMGKTDTSGISNYYWSQTWTEHKSYNHLTTASANKRKSTEESINSGSKSVASKWNAFV